MNKLSISILRDTVTDDTSAIEITRDGMAWEIYKLRATDKPLSGTFQRQAEICYYMADAFLAEMQKQKETNNAK